MPIGPSGSERDFAEVPEKLYIDDPISAYFAIRGNYNGGEGGGGSEGGSDIPSNINNPANGDILAYNPTTGKWENVNINDVSGAVQMDIDNPVSGQVMTYDATSGKWVNSNAPEAIPSNVTNPQNGQTLVYDSASGKWVNAAAPQSIPSNISNPQNGQALIYNGTSQQWENAAIQHECLVKVLAPTVTQGTGAQEGYTLYTIAESYNSLLAYINEGKLVFIKYTDNNGTHVRPLTDIYFDGSIATYFAEIGGTNGAYFEAQTASANMVWASLEDKYKNIVDVGQVDYMRVIDPGR